MGLMAQGTDLPSAVSAPQAFKVNSVPQQEVRSGLGGKWQEAFSARKCSTPATYYFHISSSTLSGTFSMNQATGLALLVAIQTKLNTASVGVSLETQVYSAYQDIIALGQTQKPQLSKLIVFFLTLRGVFCWKLPPVFPNEVPCSFLPKRSEMKG